MRTIQASEAKTHLPQLLDDVERGATLVITRRGRPIARLIPEEDKRQAEIDCAIQDIREHQHHRRTPKVSVKDILSARDEGRR